ncbi:hypothetical protein JCM14469_43160 [Desulfatiferula olefinivorans]
MFSVVDHYEPFHSGGGLQKACERVNAWSVKYPSMANKHRDSDGKPPQHSWFYPPHLDHRFLGDIIKLCKSGYGEIEMHLHHNHMEPFPDTSETLKLKILKCIEDYSKYGIFCLPNGSKTFAFIHGDWSLDNALGPEICGVNNEIEILNECGCYADFTYPSLGLAQPQTINKIYYAKDDPKKSKSYNKGKAVCVGGEPWGDLMIIQGIVGLRWKSRIHRFKPSIESSNLDRSDYPFPKRTDYWINNAVRIQGRPEWLFVKLHTHGCREVDFDLLIGNTADEMYKHLEGNYNDGEHYCLHYVTAREMYNIIKAAERGYEGNPNEYRDLVIPKYIYLT